MFSQRPRRVHHDQPPADTVPAAEAGRISHQRLDQQALGRPVAKAVAAAASVVSEAELAQALQAALRRDGPTVIGVAVDPAGYPAVMELSRGAAGHQTMPGLIHPG